MHSNTTDGATQEGAPTALERDAKDLHAAAVSGSMPWDGESLVSWIHDVERHISRALLGVEVQLGEIEGGQVGEGRPLRKAAKEIRAALLALDSLKSEAGHAGAMATIAYRLERAKVTSEEESAYRARLTMTNAATRAQHADAE